MVLAITLTRTVVSSITYNLKAEKAEIIYERTPIQAPLPAGADPLLIDIGMFRPRIVIEGVLLDNETDTDGGTAIPSKENLEDFVTDSDNSSTIKITILDDTYTCRIQSARFELVSGRENRWNYTLVFLTRKRE